MNILVLSCGTRNKIIQYFKNEIGEGLVMATDCSELAPALYEADKHFIVPRMTEEGYIDVILDICKKNNIKGVFSLIDPELSLLAEHKTSFLAIGTTPIISDYDLIEMCFDKYHFYNFLKENKYNIIKSYVDIDVFFQDVEAGIIDYPVFVKPVRGSASINVNKVTTKEEVKMLFERYDNLMIQEFIDGIEYGVDVYIDMLTGELVSIFIKEKIKMRAGETDKSVSVYDEELLFAIRNFVMLAGFKGVIDIDIFKKNDKYYISEVNPRFGGGYPHAYECGVNVPKMILNNLQKEKNKSEIGNYKKDVYMMKYNEVKIIN